MYASLSFLYYFLTQSERGEREYLKLGHLGFDKILSLKNRNAAVLNAHAYLFLLPPPVKALMRTFEVCLLQSNKSLMTLIHTDTHNSTQP